MTRAKPRDALIKYQPQNVKLSLLLHVADTSPYTLQTLIALEKYNSLMSMVSKPQSWLSLGRLWLNDAAKLSIETLNPRAGGSITYIPFIRDRSIIR